MIAPFTRSGYVVDSLAGYTLIVLYRTQKECVMQCTGSARANEYNSWEEFTNKAYRFLLVIFEL